MKGVPFSAAIAALLLLFACATGGAPAQNNARMMAEPNASPSAVRIAVADEPYPPFAVKLPQAGGPVSMWISHARFATLSS